jgi:hypothetical protein
MVCLRSLRELVTAGEFPDSLSLGIGMQCANWSTGCEENRAIAGLP